MAFRHSWSTGWIVQIGTEQAHQTFSGLVLGVMPKTATKTAKKSNTKKTAKKRK